MKQCWNIFITIIFRWKIVLVCVFVSQKRGSGGGDRGGGGGGGDGGGGGGVCVCVLGGGCHISLKAMFHCIPSIIQLQEQENPTQIQN